MCMIGEPTMESLGYYPVELPLWRASKIERAFGWSKEPDFYYEHGSVFEGPEHYFVHHGWIGCVGFLVDKVTFELLRFGSYIGPELHIWAFHEGIAINGTNTLTLIQIHDDKAAIDLLARLYRRSDAIQILQEEGPAPVSLPDVRLYFLIHELYEGRASGAFEFTAT